MQTKKKIVIVEDDIILAMVDKLYLQKIGCEVVALATNADDAVKAVRNHHPDCILMDIRIDGERDGIMAMEEIRHFSGVPVIYFSGNSETAMRQRAIDTGMFGFLTKPLDLAALKTLIELIPVPQ
jgi:CheY-like chemotaxis protein